MKTQNQKSISLLEMSFSIGIKAVVPSIVAIFTAGYALAIFISNQSHKLEVIEIRNAYNERIQEEIQRRKDLQIEYYGKKVDELENLAKNIRKGGEENEK